MTENKRTAADVGELPFSTDRIRQFTSNPYVGNLIAGPDLYWLSRHSEPTLDPDLAIVDAHHHLWDLPRAPYLTEQLLADINDGHNVIGTVFVQCSEGYLEDGPLELRPVGETKFVRSVIEKCSARGYPFVCSGIVGYADLRLGPVVDVTLDAHVAAGGGRLRGIRQSATWDGNSGVPTPTASLPEKLLYDSRFREGFGRLAPRGLSFEAWVYHHQLNDVADLARAFPATTVIINHTGGPLGIGPYAGKRAEVFDVWRKGILNAAKSSRVFIKLGGLGMPLSGFGFHERPRPPTSDDLVEAWKPYFETCIEAFGPARCMFESNFSPDKTSFSYRVLWNAYKKISSGYSAGERRQMFSGTATRVYRLEILKGPPVADTLSAPPHD
jgi:predicted TIM-barrel fold metal-dependent hydrolase